MIHSRDFHGPRFDRTLLNEMERAVRSEALTRATLKKSPADPWEPIAGALPDEPELLLDSLDYLLHNVQAGRYTGGKADALEAILDEGGSAYAVAVHGDVHRLERRVDPTVRASMDDAATAPDRASRHLANAWGLLYGRTPSPSEGYRESVKAVEAAMKPLVSPKDSTATLGKMLAALRDAPGKWALILDGGDSVDVVTAMAGLVWRGQHDRHGTDDHAVPVSVNVDEARAALHLSVTLVQWCRSGAFRRC